MDGAVAKEYGGVQGYSPTSNDKPSEFSNVQDVERSTGTGTVKPVELKRKLQSRHIQMIGMLAPLLHLALYC